jgi:hypothetical protein
VQNNTLNSTKVTVGLYKINLFTLVFNERNGKLGSLLLFAKKINSSQD